MPKPQMWWHAYGGVDEGGIWMMVIASESPMHPEEMAPKYPFFDTTGFDGKPIRLDYIRSWDHEPTEDEKEFVTPEEYRVG